MKTTIINNTDITDGFFWEEVRAAIRESRELSEHIADVVTLTRIEVDGEIRYRLDWK